jgi:topoisomerase-4 subunit A
MKGHEVDLTTIKYKEGDSQAYIMEAETTDKILLFATNGRFYTLGVDKLPSGRGFGEPVRLMIDLPGEDEILGLIKYEPDAKYIVASTDGRGFVVKAADVLAQTKNGKQILNVDDKAKAASFAPLEQVPEMARGKGVILQKYKDGHLSDIKCFALKEGLSWASGDRTRTETDLRAWIGERAQSGRMPPTGFAKNNKFM